MRSYNLQLANAPLPERAWSWPEGAKRQRISCFFWKFVPATCNHCFKNLCFVSNKNTSGFCSLALALPGFYFSLLKSPFSFFKVPLLLINPSWFFSVILNRLSCSCLSTEALSCLNWLILWLFATIPEFSTLLLKSRQSHQYHGKDKIDSLFEFITA